MADGNFDGTRRSPFTGDGPWKKNSDHAQLRNCNRSHLTIPWYPKDTPEQHWYTLPPLYCRKRTTHCRGNHVWSSSRYIWTLREERRVIAGHLVIMERGKTDYGWTVTFMWYVEICRVNIHATHIWSYMTILQKLEQLTRKCNGLINNTHLNREHLSSDHY